MPEPAATTDTVVEPKEAPDLNATLDRQLGGEPAPPVTGTNLPAPTWRDVEMGDDAPEHFRKKKVGDFVTSWEHGQQAVQRFQSERDRAVAENQRLQTQLTARQAAEQSIREMLHPPAQDQPDPRYEQLNDLIFSDPKAFRELYDTLQNERLETRLTTEREKIKKEISGELTTQRNRDTGNWAWTAAQNQLRAMGVSDAAFTRANVASVYTVLTLPSTEYEQNPYGSNALFDPNMIIAAWRSQLPHTVQAAPPAAAAEPAPAAMIPAPSTAPGGGRPAAAVTPPPRDAGKPMSNELLAVFESFAEAAGKPKDHLIKKARGAA